ncbi:MAG: FHA domain-containing protein [Cyanobacteria bacterium J06634_6]
MPQINFVWKDSHGRDQAYQMSLLKTDTDKKVNIGRDQQKCELWLAHNTVSRVHAELTFKPDWQRFYLRNLAPKNPVRIDGGILVEGEVALCEQSVIQFGQLLLQVSSVTMDENSFHGHTHLPPSSPPELLVPPNPQQSSSVGSTAPPGGGAANASAGSSGTPSQNAAPKLLCPKCKTMQSLSLRNSNCPVCGHFLADASSRYFF